MNHSDFLMSLVQSRESSLLELQSLATFLAIYPANTEQFYLAKVIHHGDNTQR